MPEKLHQVKSKQSNGESICASIREEFEEGNAPKHCSKQLKDKYAKQNMWTLDAAIPMMNIQNILVTLRTFLNQLTIFYSHPRTFIPPIPTTF